MLFHILSLYQRSLRLITVKAPVQGLKGRRPQGQQVRSTVSSISGAGRLVAGHAHGKRRTHL